MNFKWLLMTLMSMALSACLGSEPDKLKSLVVEFPETGMMDIQIVSERGAFQYVVPSDLLADPSQLQHTLQRLPDALKPEVFSLLAEIEPPASAPLSKKLSQSVAVLQGFIGAIGDDVEQLQQELESNRRAYQNELKQHMGKLSDEAKRLAEQTEQTASNLVSKIKSDYVLHIAELIEQDQLSEADVQRLEQALIERHHRMRSPKE